LDLIAISYSEKSTVGVKQMSEKKNAGEVKKEKKNLDLFFLANFWSETKIVFL
jgi:hypothetical protein